MKSICDMNPLIDNLSDIVSESSVNGQLQHYSQIYASIFKQQPCWLRAAQTSVPTSNTVACLKYIMLKKLHGVLLFFILFYFMVQTGKNRRKKPED